MEVVRSIRRAVSSNATFDGASAAFTRFHRSQREEQRCGSEIHRTSVEVILHLDGKTCSAARVRSRNGIRTRVLALKVRKRAIRAIGDLSLILDASPADSGSIIIQRKTTAVSRSTRVAYASET